MEKEDLTKKILTKKIEEIVEKWDTDTTLRYWNQLCDDEGWPEMRIVPVDGTTDKYFKEDEPDVSSYDIYDLGADDSEIIEWLVFDIYFGYKNLEDLEGY